MEIVLAFLHFLVYILSSALAFFIAYCIFIAAFLLISLTIASSSEKRKEKD